MHTHCEYDPVARYLDRVAESPMWRSVIFTRHHDDLHFYGLANGDRYRTHYEIGAQKCLEQTADFLETESIKGICHAECIDKQKSELLREYRQALHTLEREYDLPADEFSSRLVALLLDGKAGEFAAVNLGDGFILGMSSKGIASLVSLPEIPVFSRCTRTTASANAPDHIRFSFGSLDEYARLFIGTSGISGLIKSGRLQRILRGSSSEEALQRIRNCIVPDDTGCIIIDF